MGVPASGHDDQVEGMAHHFYRLKDRVALDRHLDAVRQAPSAPQATTAPPSPAAGRDRNDTDVSLMLP